MQIIFSFFFSSEILLDKSFLVAFWRSSALAMVKRLDNSVHYQICHILELLPQRVTSLNRLALTAMHYKSRHFRQDTVFCIISYLLELIKLADNRPDINSQMSSKYGYIVHFSFELLALNT